MEDPKVEPVEMPVIPASLGRYETIMFTYPPLVVLNEGVTRWGVFTGLDRSTNQYVTWMVENVRSDLGQWRQSQGKYARRLEKAAEHHAEGLDRVFSYIALGTVPG